MLHSREKSLRGRHFEDLDDLEEKGYLKRGDSDIGQGSGVRDKLLNGSSLKVERNDEEFEGGLSSRRDKEAFALLVVLCKWTFWQRVILRHWM
jgi:PAT family acetyl-CoA transporter-like MFS transporter 1